MRSLGHRRRGNRYLQKQNSYKAIYTRITQPLKGIMKQYKYKPSTSVAKPRPPTDPRPPQRPSNGTVIMRATWIRLCGDTVPDDRKVKTKHKTCRRMKRRLKRIGKT